MEKNYKMVAKTFFGFEDILATELRNLGAMHVTKGVRSVQFEGDKGFMYKANLCLRTALKILTYAARRNTTRSSTNLTGSSTWE